MDLDVLVLVVATGQPGGKTFHWNLELGVEVDEFAQPVCHPGERDPLLAPSLAELLDSAVGEVHPGYPNA